MSKHGGLVGLGVTVAALALVGGVLAMDCCQGGGASCCSSNAACCSAGSAKAASAATATTAKPAAAAKVVNAKCPIMGGAIDPKTVPDALIREFKGQKVGFCCAGCPAQWDKLSDAEKEAKLKAISDVK